MTDGATDGDAEGVPGTGGPDDATEPSQPAEPAETGDTDAAPNPLLFLAGFLLFVLSTLAFLTDLATGYDPLRSLSVNLIGTVGMVTWAAMDTYSDPESEVSSVPGAVGTALLLFGAYALVAGAVVALTTLWHDRFDLVLPFLAVGLTGVIGGFAAFPAEVFLGDDEPESAETDDEA